MMQRYVSLFYGNVVFLYLLFSRSCESPVNHESLSHGGSMTYIFTLIFLSIIPFTPCIDCRADFASNMISNSHMGLAMFAEDRTPLLLLIDFLLIAINNAWVFPGGN